MLPITKKAYEAVIAQGEPSIDATGACVYRGPGGLKCAVGHVIPDEVYDPKMEGLHIYQIVSGYSLGVSVEEQRELYSLQEAHDFAAHESDFLRAFELGVKSRFSDVV